VAKKAGTIGERGTLGNSETLARDGIGTAVADRHPGFDGYRPSDVRDLIAEYPLAWVCPRDGDAAQASLLPLIGEYGPDGSLTHLTGHLARRNPLSVTLGRSGRALALFTGPEAYISPRDVGDRSWAPTWNYAQLRVEIEAHPDPDYTVKALEVLIEAMEAGRADPWRAAELGNRYEDMLEQIVGFRARVVEVHGKFKLGQDENPSIFRQMLSSTADPAMKRWMERFNPHRE
jgi:transcriptional regulator